MPKTPVSFAGPSYFGGKNDELVICAGKGKLLFLEMLKLGANDPVIVLALDTPTAGDIHIWDRESGALLHHVRGQSIGGDLTCIAWNNAAEDPFMFATGSHDGGVRIWTVADTPGISIRNSDGIHIAGDVIFQLTPRPSTQFGIESRTESPIDDVEFGLRQVNSSLADFNKPTSSTAPASLRSLAPSPQTSSAPLSREPSRTRNDAAHHRLREGSLDVPLIQHGHRDRAITFSRTPSPRPSGSHEAT